MNEQKNYLNMEFIDPQYKGQFRIDATAYKNKWNACIGLIFGKYVRRFFILDLKLYSFAYYTSPTSRLPNMVISLKDITNVLPNSLATSQPSDAPFGFTVVTVRRPFHLFVFTEKTKVDFLYAFSSVLTIPDRPRFKDWDLAYDCFRKNAPQRSPLSNPKFNHKMPQDEAKETDSINGSLDTKFDTESVQEKCILEDIEQISVKSSSRVKNNEVVICSDVQTLSLGKTGRELESGDTKKENFKNCEKVKIKKEELKHVSIEEEKSHTIGRGSRRRVHLQQDESEIPCLVDEHPRVVPQVIKIVKKCDVLVGSNLEERTITPSASEPVLKKEISHLLQERAADQLLDDLIQVEVPPKTYHRKMNKKQPLVPSIPIEKDWDFPQQLLAPKENQNDLPKRNKIEGKPTRKVKSKEKFEAVW